MEGESGALDEQMTILKDQGIATIDGILSGFAKTTAGIHISADGTGTLLSQERLQISVLAQHLIAGREVEDNISTSHSQVITWGDRRPYVFADLNTKLHAIGGDKKLRL